MSTYFIGDIHGCYKNLNTMLERICFNPNTDTLHLTGDLVARGPNELAVLRLIYTFGKKAHVVLGNHDLHLLKTYFNTTCHNHKQHKNYFSTILNAPDADELIYWLRHQPILYIDENKKILMIHAGIHPNWNIQQIKKYAQEIESLLISDHASLIFNQEYIKYEINNNIKIDKLKKIHNHINVFTRIRYMYANGTLNMRYKNSPELAPNNIYPWFNMPISIIPEYNIIFGHWASLTKNINIPDKIYGLDSGCCWNGSLTSLQWENKKIVTIPCTPPE